MNSRTIYKNGVSSFTLKCIAIISMALDHIGVFLIPAEFCTPFRIAGRLAFPIFCFFISEGFVHTKNKGKYFIRLLCIAIISEPIVDKIFFSSYIYLGSQNAIFTLLIGLLVLWGLEKSIYIDNKLTITKKKLVIEYALKAMIMLLAAIAISLLHTEYGILGLAMILAFYFFREKAILLVISFIVINSLYFNWIQLFACLAIIPIFFYNGELGRRVKYLFYAFYPVHFIIIYLISILLIINTLALDSTNNNYNFFKSDIISSESVTSTDLQDIINIQTYSVDGKNIITAFSLVKDSMAIFTMENDQGWKLNNGNAFSLSFSLDFSNNKEMNNAEILFGMIVDGFYSELIPIEDNMFEMTINAFQDGEYYFAITNISPYTIIVDNGEIIIE